MRIRNTRYCFLYTKSCMHNEVGGCAEILPEFVAMVSNWQKRKNEAISEDWSKNM